MANLRIIKNMNDMFEFCDALDKLKDENDNVITSDAYVSPLTDDCVTTDNMKFKNAEKLTDANLLIFKSQGGKCYALAYAYEYDPDVGEDDKEEIQSLKYVLKDVLEEAYLASGTCSVGADGTTTNIKLELTENCSTLGDSGNDGLHFSNANVNGIEGSDASDIIYIDSQGVDSIATLIFSKGNDTIKFNDATTVNAIRGGGREQYTYSSA